MSNGPPPSAAESSSVRPKPAHHGPFSSPLTPSTSQPPNLSMGGAGMPGQSAYSYNSWPVNWSGYPMAVVANPVVPPSSTTAAPYYNVGGYYNHAGYYPTQAPQPTLETQAIPHFAPVPKIKEEDLETVPRDALPPPLDSYRHWDEAMKAFLKDAGFHETLKGFENDIFVMSADWEQQRIPKALQTLVKRLTIAYEYSDAKDPEKMNVDDEPPISLDERKLSYMSLAGGAVPRTPTSTNKSISQLLAKNRARINASNRSEFLYSLTERRRHIQQSSPTTTIDPSQLGSCARTDARPIDRDEQMKYDIAKNDDAPLSRTIKNEPTEQAIPSISTTEKGTLSIDELIRRQQDGDRATAAQHPALDERLKNVETHFAVRYVPSPPRTLTSRLKLLEDHIIKLEKEYPPWAALHFNQPNRGWPPPPRTTPIIVPPNLRSKEEPHATGVMTGPSNPTTTEDSNAPKPTGKQKNPKSSLHRAVMERLQVQQAMNDLGRD